MQNKPFYLSNNWITVKAIFPKDQWKILSPSRLFGHYIGLNRVIKDQMSKEQPHPIIQVRPNTHTNKIRQMHEFIHSVYRSQFYYRRLLLLLFSQRATLPSWLQMLTSLKKNGASHFLLRMLNCLFIQQPNGCMMLLYFLLLPFSMELPFCKTTYCKMRQYT